MKRSPRQLDLPLRRRGGARPGAGRKPNGPRAGVSHLTRPHQRRYTPVHLTLRVRPHVWNLRSRRCFRRIERAFWAGHDRFGFRLNQFSIQGNHLHLIAEADDNRALSRGMQGLAIRIARSLNRLMARTGAVFADRYHAHVLRAPNEVRRAVHYVLDNRRRHVLKWQISAPGAESAAVDEYSSARYWRWAVGPPPLAAPRTEWLRQAVAAVMAGWNRRGR